MFDLIKKRVPKRHVLSDIEKKCTQCGLDLWQCQWSECDPDSDEAKAYRKKVRDTGVGRAIQRY